MDHRNDARKVIIYGDQFWKFYNQQSDRVKERINWTIKLVQSLDRIPKKYFKHVINTRLYEMRIISGNNIYRIFCFFDEGNVVVVINGFQKKTQKIPKRHIKLALRLQKQYFDEKEE